VRFRTIAAFACGPMIGSLLGFMTLPLITWLYSPEDIGRISMLVVVANFSILFLSLGLDQSYVREYSESSDKKLLFKMAILPGLLLLVLLFIYFSVGSSSLSEMLFGMSALDLSMLAMIYIFSSYINRFLSLILRMEQRGLVYSVSQIIPKIVLLVLIGIFYWLDIDTFFYSLLLMYVLSIVLVSFILLHSTRMTWLFPQKKMIDWSELIKMLRFGAPLILGGAAYWGLTAIDKIFIRYFSDYQELGIYSVAISFAAVATIIQSVFSTVWSPVVYKWVADNDDLSKVDDVREYLLFIVLLVFSLAGLFSWLVNFILPEQYIRVQYLLVVCLAAPLLYTLSETTVVGLGVTRNSKLSMLASILAFIFNLFGNYLLVPRYGAEGAAVSTALSFWVFLIFRTEFSNYVWKPIRQIKLYSLSFLAVLVSSLFMIYGESFPQSFIIVWLLMLLMVLLINLSLSKVLFLKVFG